MFNIFYTGSKVSSSIFISTLVYQQNNYCLP
uniref:Uncharacterized protein n=1 Tax=Arundo donax TaxID=35708 RepID=A0A0A9F8W9_ARUDO